MELHNNKTKLIFGLVIISAIFLYLRIDELGHLLMWDEAWNILSLKAYLANDTSSPFYWFFRFHPPAYMFFGKMLMPLERGIDIRLEGLSLTFSYATLIVVYLLSSKIGGWRYSWLTGLMLSLMPASIGYDTWIKRDSLAAFAGYTALLLLAKRRFIWCAVALGFSLLSKENGIFFLMASFLMIFILKEKKPFRKILLISLVVAALTSWWYLLFSEMTTHGISFFFSKTDYSMPWSNSSLYYFKKLVPDLGWAILILTIIGSACIIYRTFIKKQPRWFFPLSVVLCVYIPISFLFTLKAPWLPLPSFAAIAMIAAGGALWMLKKAKKSKAFFAAFFLLIIFTVYTGLSFSYPGYHTKTYPNGWPGASSSKNIALYLNSQMDENDKFLITEFEYWKTPMCPIFEFYSDLEPVRILGPDEPLANLMDEVTRDKVSWLVIIDSPEKESKTRVLAENIRDYLIENPKKVGWGYVWNVERLWRDKD